MLNYDFLRFQPVALYEPVTFLGDYFHGTITEPQSLTDVAREERCHRQREAVNLMTNLVCDLFSLVTAFKNNCIDGISPVLM